MINYQLHKNDTQEQIRRVWANLKSEIKTQFSAGSIEITIKDIKKSPTNEGRGYLWAEILPKLRLMLISFGNDIPMNATGLKMVYIMMKEQANLYEIKKIKLKGVVIENKVYESFGNSKGDKDKMTYFIDFCIRFGSEWGMQFESPEDYKM